MFHCFQIKFSYFHVQFSGRQSTHGVLHFQMIFFLILYLLLWKHKPKIEKTCISGADLGGGGALPACMYVFITHNEEY